MGSNESGSHDAEFSQNITGNNLFSPGMQEDIPSGNLSNTSEVTRQAVKDSLDNGMIHLKEGEESAPKIEWEKSFGGSTNDEAKCIQQTSDGGYIIAGYAASNNDDVTGHHGGRDYWIVKLNITGTIEWEKCLGGSSPDEAFSINQTSDGGYIVAGYTSSTDGDVSGYHGNGDYWVVKLNSTGNMTWQKCLGGSRYDIASSIQPTNDGGYIVTGRSCSNDGDVTGHHGSTGYYDYWVVKLDSSGNIAWEKCLGGSSHDEASSIQQTSDGGYIIAGDSASDNGNVTGNHGSYDYWVVKLDSSGNIVWEKSLGGSSADEASSIQQTSDGGYIVAGSSDSYGGDVTGHNHFYADYWVVKLDSSGNIVWEKCYGGDFPDKATSIDQTTDGGYIVIGFTRSDDGDVTEYHGNGDYWVVKLDLTGTIEWEKCYGGNSQDEAFSITQTSDNGYILAGYSESDDGDVSKNYGRSDYWVTKLEGTSYEEKSLKSVRPASFTNSSKESILNIKGTGFESGMNLTLRNVSLATINALSVFNGSIISLTGKFNLYKAPLGTYDLIATWPDGTVSTLNNSVSIRSLPEGVGYQDTNLTVTKKAVSNIPISISTDHENLFITLQKTTSSRNDHWNWQGTLRILSGDTVLKSDTGNQDQLIHLQNVSAGEYTIQIIPSESGSGVLTVYDALPELPIGDWTTEEVLRPYGSVFNQVTVPDDSEVFRLDAEAIGSWSNFRVYHKYWGSNKTWIGKNGPNAYVKISDPDPGLYILSFQDTQMISGDDQRRDVMLKANLTSTSESQSMWPQITSFIPQTGGNSGNVTLTIKGGALKDSQNVSLSGSGGTLYAGSVTYNSDTSLSATFNLAGQSPGTYTLTVANVTNTDQKASSAAPFTITSGGSGGFYAEVSGREKIRNGYASTYVITYGNNGTVDIPAQLVSIGTNPSSSQISARFLPDGTWQTMEQPVTMFCTGSGDGQTILPAGSEYTREISVKATSLTDFSLYVIPYGSPEVYSPQTLESVTDILVSGPGVPLSMGRSYGAGHLRYNGPFGYGWIHSYDTKLERFSSSCIGLKQGDSYGDILVKQSDGMYLSSYGYPSLSLKSDGSSVLTGKDGSTATFGSDLLLKSISDTRDNTLTLNYQGTRLSSISHSDGDKITLGYDSAGRITSLTDPYAKKTTFTYGNNLLTSVISPAGTTTYGYSESDGGYELSNITYPGGIEAHFTTDSAGRVSKITANNGRDPVSYAYKSDTHETTATDATGSSVQVTVNDDGNIIKVVDQAPSTTSFTYSGKYDLTGYTDPSGKVYATGYDTAHNPVSLTDAAGSVTKIAYDTRFNTPSKATDAKGNSITLVYDDDGNLKNLSYPDGSVESREYSAQGIPTSVTTRSGDRINYEYNSHGQLTKVTYPDGTAYSYQYDQGNLVQATGPDGTITMVYDSADRLTQITYPDGKWIKYTYNTASLVTKKELSDGMSTGYSYDAIGNLVSVTDGLGTVVAGYSYDAAGRLIRTVLGSGVNTAYSYDTAGRMSSLINSAPNGSVLSKFLYQYDNNGNPITVNTTEGTTIYEYDVLNQLTNVTYPDGSKESYSYDAVGNRVSVSEGGATSSYVTNSMNQYTSTGGQSFAYDLNGNLISKTEGGATTTYEYRADNRITKVSSPVGIWEYSYDPLGNRNKVIHNGVTESYLIDPMGLGKIVASSLGNQITHYRYGLGLLSQTNPAGNEYSYLFDLTGHTSQIVSSNGTIMNQYRYAPFGEYREKTEGIKNPFTYVGQFGVMDDENGLYYMRMREYDPIFARFISEDYFHIIKENSYLYCNNNPIIYRDSNGLAFVFANWGMRGLKGVSVSGSFVYDGKNGFRINPANLNYGLKGVDVPSNLFNGGIFIFSGEYNDGNVLNAAFPIIPLGPIGLLIAFRVNKDGTTNIGIGIGKPGISFNLSGLKKLLMKLFTDESSISLETVYTLDPEDKFGPSGYDPSNTTSLHRYIPATTQTLPYRVDIWNKENATADVRDIYVYDEIDSNLNRSSFGFTDVGFMNWTVPLDNTPSFLVYVDTRPAMDLIVKIEGMYNPDSGMVNLSYESLDPTTLQPPEDTTIGFLPPITSDGTEIAWFAYSADTRPGLATGTEIQNRAWVQFDGIGAYNPAPPNQSYVNTIDASKPVSKLTASANGTTVNVLVSGSDAGSGISGYTIFASMDNGEYYPAVSGVTGAITSFVGSKGHTYRLYSQATDNVGNVEDTHSSPDATVTITAQENPILSRVSPNSAITGSGPVSITASGSGFTASSLVRLDGSALSTGYVSGTELRGEIPAAYLTTSGTRSIDVLNSDSELVSNSLPFTIASGRTWYITGTSSGNGTISPSGLVAVPEGGDQAFTITPNTGFSIEDVLVDGDSIGVVPGYTFSNVVSNRTINARFAEIIVNQHSINATSDDWTINYPHGNRTYPEGSNKTYVTQAKPGAELSDVKVDTISQGSVTSYPFTNITGDHTITTEGNPATGQVHVFFNITPRSGKTPLTVEYTDQSLGNPDSWYWQFGDGTNSTEKNTTHTYRIPGVYSVKLQAFNNKTSGTGVCNGCVTVT